MKLDKILDYINFITSKDDSGDTMSPDQFNVLLDGVNLELYNEKFEEMKMHAQQANIPFHKALYNCTELKPFKIKETTGNFINGVYNLPGDFKYYLKFFAEYNSHYVNVDIITDDQMNERRSDKINKPLNEYPAGIAIDDYFQFYPTDFGQIKDSVEVTYLKEPSIPYYDWFMDNSTAERVYFDPDDNYTIKYDHGLWRVYDNSNTLIYSDITYSRATNTAQSYTSQTIELEWEDIYHTMFINRLLEKIGIPRDDEKVERYAQQEQQKGE